MPDNIERADRASAALETYCEVHPDYIDGIVIDETVICDFLTDLRHYCAQQEIDIDQILTTSEINYNEERAEG